MKKILFSLMTLVLVIGLVGAGAFAYFSDTETSEDNIFTAGTLDLSLADGQSSSDSVTGTWSSPAGWAPGETFEVALEFTNTGTVDAHEIWFKFYNLNHTDGDSDGSNLMDAIIVSGFYERFDNDTSINQVAILDRVWYGNDGTLTLADLAGRYKGQYFLHTYDGEQPYIEIDGDGITLGAGNLHDYALIMEFTFDPDAGNEYQGDTCSFDLDVMATQERNRYP